MKKEHRRHIFLFSLLTVLMSVVAAYPSVAQSESCISGSCHATFGKFKFMHAPVKDGCSTCHQVTREPANKTTKHPGNLTITLMQADSDLCSMCHEPKNTKKTVHAPIMGKDCTSCHNPHGSPNKGMLKVGVPNLCFQCHPDNMMKHKIKHPPAASGNCSFCHDNHQSDLPKRLVKPEPELCLTCHAAVAEKLKTGKVAHPPVKQSCTPCHSPHGSDQKAMLTAPIPALCSNCHEPKNTKKVVHAPITGGDCLTCHHPHQSAEKGMLREPMPQLCFQCHPDSMLKQKVMHPPVAAGDCSGCHDNHQSDFPNRLVAEGNRLCYTCHPDKEEGLKTKKTSHQPVRQSCVQCHSPHGSANKAMMTAPVPALCSKCHPNETSLMEKAAVKHGPMIDAKTCLNCHEPHYSDNARLLQEPQMDLCLRCHNKQLDTERGKIMDMKTLLAIQKNSHGPLREKDCTSCHNPHGSDYWRILSRYYPADFYTPYSVGKYALCFSCHDKAAFQGPRTDEATGFRNGRKNLHYIHVNKVGKGRTCRACHEVHADSGSLHHVRQNVGFNGWLMPMNYSPNKTGGSCAPGCHGEKSYTR